MKKGCYRDLSGQTFGRLTAKGLAGYYHNPSGRRATKWQCECACGKIVEVIGTNLTSGHATSCGCFRLEQKTRAWTTHGHASGRIAGRRTKTSTYRSWLAMRERCRRESHEFFRLYGGRGITICEKWNDFEAFLADMGERPPGMCIERKDTNGNYEPENCRWATMKEQGNNRRNNRRLEIDGKIQTATAWSEKSGIDARTIIHRLNRGWEPKRAVFSPTTAPG